VSVAKRRKKAARIWWRDQGGEKRAYGDFRSLGADQEALIPRGETRATTDPEVAAVLFAERVKELEGIRRHKGIHGRAPAPRLEDYCVHHLEEKLKAGRVGEQHVRAARQTLRSAVLHLGAMTLLDAITVQDVQRWMNALAKQSDRKGGTLAGETRRKYLSNLSNVFRRAQAEGVVPPGYNPASALMDKPQGRRFEAKWLEVPEAALLLEAARTYRPKRPDMAVPGIHAILATFLLTGGRLSEVLGLDLEDVSFDRRRIIFRPNAHRRLKTTTSHRVVPLWPQLEHVLRAWVFDPDEPRATGLLFPGPDGRMIGDFDKQLDAIAARCGWQPGEIRSRALRHTYCAARLQTTDHEAAVSPYTVAKELGHGGMALVNKVYGHLGEVRQRSAVVEYWPEDHRKVLGDRLAALARSA
jgi:integrase